MIDDRTSLLDLPLPHQTNRLLVDVGRLRESFTEIDGHLAKMGASVTNVSELRLTDKTKNASVSTKGYYTAGDGGHGSYWYDASDTASADNGGSVIVGADGARWKIITGEWVSIRQFGGRGDGTTDDTAAYLNAQLFCMASTKNITLDGEFLVDAGAIDITRSGFQIVGYGTGNVANLTPVGTPLGASLIIKGVGVGIRIRAQDVTLSGFRLTSDTSRAAAAFDISSAGVRVEPDDTATARADRAKLNIRIDSQSGDGVLVVGSALYMIAKGCDIYSCKGFGVRLDSGTLAELARANTHYVGLAVIDDCRIGYCGGHSIAASNPSVTTQSDMAIRLTVTNLDTFGNGSNPSIMYPSADGIFYEAWIFGENCQIKNSAISGNQGLALTPEAHGGVWIAGRDNKLSNNRYLYCSQPIYWGHNASQPSTGLVIDQIRIVNTGGVLHSDCIKIQSASSKGLTIKYDRVEYFTEIATRRVGATSTDFHAQYQSIDEHTTGLFNTGTAESVADDSVLVIPILGLGGAVTAGAVLTLAMTSVANGGGIFHLRFSPSTPIATKWAGESNTIAYSGGGALTGTTGTDGMVNISTSGDSLYIENRRGFAINFNYQISAIPKGLAVY